MYRGSRVISTLRSGEGEVSLAKHMNKKKKAPPTFDFSLFDFSGLPTAQNHGASGEPTAQRSSTAL